MVVQTTNLAFEQAKFKASQFREANELISEKRRFEATSRSKRTEGWDFQNKGPVSDQLRSLRDLRGLSRSFLQNNAYAQKAINVLVNHIVGTGIQPAFAKTGAGKLKEEWDKWATDTFCDFSGLMDMYSLQELVMRAVLESGDAIVLQRTNQDNPHNPIELQVLESDYLDDQKTESLENGHYVIQGVEFSNIGKRVAYWLFWEHPGDGGYTDKPDLASRRVPADQVLHIFEVLRPGQVRGIPAGVAAFVRLKNFDEYQDFQLYKQKVAACFVMTITPTDQSMQSPNVPLWKDFQPLDRMGPGIIETLPYGAKAEFSQPPQADGSDNFMLTELRAIAGAYGITYEALANDYSQVNFTSGRMGGLEMNRNIQRLQQKVMVTMFCKPTYRWFAFGLTVLKGIKSNALVTWTSPRREMIDPVKETDAMVEQVRAGFKSRENGIREMGEDPDDVNSEIKRDMEVADKMGAKFSSDPRYDVQREKKQATTEKEE